VKILPFIVATLLSLSGTLSAQATALPPALPDQFGATGALSDFPRAPVLVIVVSARRLRQVQRWEEALRSELPGLLSMRVADIDQQPQPQLDDVAGTLAKRAPAGVPILIDMDNEWARAFALNTREPCLLLFDANRKLVTQWRGRARAELVSAVIAGIQGLPSAGTSERG
jgi:hypothetical protein